MCRDDPPPTYKALGHVAPIDHRVGRRTFDSSPRARCQLARCGVQLEREALRADD